MHECSTLCHTAEPCFITECGTCDIKLIAIEDWQERAAIIEYCAEIPRINAESMALRDVVERRGKEAGRAIQAWRQSRD